MIVAVRLISRYLRLVLLAVVVSNLAITADALREASGRSSHDRSTTPVDFKAFQYGAGNVHRGVYNSTLSASSLAQSLRRLPSKLKDVRANKSATPGNLVMMNKSIKRYRIGTENFFVVTSSLIAILCGLLVAFTVADYFIHVRSQEWRPVYLEVKSHAVELESQASSGQRAVPDKQVAGRHVSEDFFRHPELFCKIDFDQLVSEIGISTLCLLDLRRTGLTGLPCAGTLCLLAAQTWFLQGLIMYFMYWQLSSSLSDDVSDDSFTPGVMGGKSGQVPLVGIVVVIFLHIIRVLGPMPLCLTLLQHLQDIHESWSDYLLAMFVFIVETIIVDVCTIVIGGMLLCTSHDIIHAVLLTCELFLICDIGTLIMQMNSKMNRLGGTVKEMVVCVPVRKGLVKSLNLVFTVVPIVPLTLSIVLCYIGVNILHMPVLH